MDEVTQNLEQMPVGTGALVDGADYLQVNRRYWDDRAPAHYAGYGIEKYLEDPDYLSSVVSFDRAQLGDVTGLRGVHLQCHIGTDTLSLHRLGAQMSGLDLSPVSIEHARRLAEKAGAEIDYYVADVFDAVSVLGQRFDLVYTGVGALCWLPSIARWAEVVAGLLAPGGRLFLREGHPMLGALEMSPDGVLQVEYPYFEIPAAMQWTDQETYVETEVPLAMLPTQEWNHGIGEVFTALTEQGLRVTHLVEHDSAPWQPFPGWMQPHPVHREEWRLSQGRHRVAMSYTLQAVAPD